jgi:hypothetical protein
MDNLIEPMLKQLLERAILLSEMPLGVEQIQNCRPGTWLAEYGTVAIRSHRQSGHTTAIMHLRSMFKNPLVVFPYGDRAPSHWQVKPIGELGIFHELTAGKLNGKDFDAVFVDDASNYTDNDMEQIEDFTARMIRPGHPCFLVLVG